MIELDRETGARPADATGEVIARTPGATVRSIGGLGQFSAVSLRGGTPEQTGVFIDGVPIGSSLAGLVDLGSLPLDGFDEIHVYRGHIPIAFGGAAIGGVIDLRSARPKDRPELGVDAGVGSFGARQARARVSVPVRKSAQVQTRIGYAGADGDFPYFDDSGTPLFTGDDGFAKRRNNNYDRVLAGASVQGRVRSWRLSARELVVWKRQGIAGRASAPTSASDLDTIVARTIARASRPGLAGPAGRLTWVGGLGVERRRFRDPLGEVGLGRDDERLTSIDVYLSPRLRVGLWRGAFLGIVADQRTEWTQVNEGQPAPATSGDSTRLRAGVGFGVELEQFAIERRLLVAPAIRIDALASRFAASAGDGEIDDLGRDDFAVGYSPRVAGRLRVLPGLSLRTSGGRYFRPPTLLELFGDRGYVIGNEGLRSERGTVVDGGLILDLDRDAGRVYAQLVGFGVWSEDLIQWIAAGPVTRPENVSAARMRGMEVSLDAAPSRPVLAAQASYTLLDAIDQSSDETRHGQPLPGRPRHDLFVRGSSGWDFEVRGVTVFPRVFYTAEFIAGTRLDPSDRFELPLRAIQGLGAEVSLARRIHLAFEVRNLLNVRTAGVTFPVGNARPVPVAISDFIGFPLPGRSVFFTMRVDMELSR